ncbi:MAG: hypothetical protein AABZ58_09785 [Chloroflexota bacterium]
MNKTLQWTVGISAVLIALAVVFSTVMPFIAPQLGWGNTYGYFPGGMMGGFRGGMMGGFGLPFFGFGMILWPVLFVGLIVLGIVWLVRTVSTPGAPAAPQAACAHCGKPVQAAWKACPYCGEKL